MNSEVFQTDNFSTKALGRRLRAAREYLGLSQVELANAVKRTKASISNNEHGRSYPRLEVLLWFYRNHQIDPNYFICGQPHRLPSEVCEGLERLLKEND